MTLTQLVDERGRALRLGPKVGEGGEGAVYRVADGGGQAIKIYSAPLTAEKIEKIRILSRLSNPQVSRFTAWPSGLALDERGHARGVLLPLVEGGKDVHQLYTPSSRRQHFPTAGWPFLVHVSANIARAFAAIHELGLVIGDVNPGSILVLRDGTVRLIDVDSFQVPRQGGRPLLCTVAVPLFLPPELHQAQLNTVVRTPDHDAFGLAITVFQLLMLGRHPYAGRYLGTGEMPIERAIVEHRFAYSSRAPQLDMQRPPHTVGLNILSPPVAALFERAFAPTAGGRPRPTAKDWAHALGAMTSTLTQCRLNTTHQYPRESSVCPWCSFEHGSGVLLFGVAAVTTPHVNDAEYQKLLRLAARVPTPSPSFPTSTTGQASPNPAAHGAGKTPRSALVLYITSALILVAGLVLAPPGLLLVVVSVILAIVATTKREKSRRPWIQAYRVAHSQHDAAKAELYNANRFPMYAASQAAIFQATQAWQDVPRIKNARYQELERNKRQAQFQQFMLSKRIEAASIPGVGAGRVAMLSAYGIDTAWDISAARVAQVPQFGPVLTERLVVWRKVVERSFTFNPSGSLPKDAVARVERELEEMRRRILQELRRAVGSLQAAAVSETSAAEAAARRLSELIPALQQAEADVLAAIGKIPR